MTWRTSAACAGTDSDVFFPSAATVRARGGFREARRICAGCTVVAECLEDALSDRHDLFGFRGGMTPEERSRVRRGPAVRGEAHGGARPERRVS